jgi:hypothetical protein
VKEERVIRVVKPSVFKHPAFLSEYVISLPAVLKKRMQLKCKCLSLQNLLAVSQVLEQ